MTWRPDTCDVSGGPKTGCELAYIDLAVFERATRQCAVHAAMTTLTPHEAVLSENQKKNRAREAVAVTLNTLSNPQRTAPTAAVDLAWRFDASRKLILTIPGAAIRTSPAEKTAVRAELAKIDPTIVLE